MSSLLKRHSTLLAFTLSIASSVAFVACGDDDPTPPKDVPEAGAGGSGTGGKATGGAGTGGKATGGGGGAGGGPTGGTGGVVPNEGGDVGSNGDAASDAADD